MQRWRDKTRVKKEALLAAIPEPWPEDLFPGIQARVSASRRTVVALDDDPTGTQTVHDVPVLTAWSVAELRAALTGPGTLFYVLTNSRSYPTETAVAMNQEIAHNLATASLETGRAFELISRSDSTLRGHYPQEMDALQAVLQERLGITYRRQLIIPFFAEGGRFTVGDEHWVQEGEWLVPAAQTEYARDAVFGYQHSHLPLWIEEKSGGRIPSRSVLTISLEEIRGGGPEHVARRLSARQPAGPAVVNAVCYRDIEVLVAALLQLEEDGVSFLSRAAASFVRVRGGVPMRGLLTPSEIIPQHAARPTGGLVLVGSHIRKSTEQLGEARRLGNVVSLELNVDRVLATESRDGEVRRVGAAADRALRDGQDVIVYTSRLLAGASEEIPGGPSAREVSSLQTGQSISAALVETVRRVRTTPRFVVAKGGITSSDIATRALGVARASVAGQILPGVPVWRLGAESRFPGIPYVVFPGNVGDRRSLARVIALLSGDVSPVVVA